MTPFLNLRSKAGASGPITPLNHAWNEEFTWATVLGGSDINESEPLIIPEKGDTLYITKYRRKRLQLGFGSRPDRQW
jgi:hypothetical protein